MDPHVIAAFRSACATCVSAGPHVIDWRGSPFEPLRSMANRRKSAVGVRTVRELILRRFKILLHSSVSPAAALAYGAMIVKVKTCIQWENGNVVYEQIRSDEPYDLLVMAAFCPDDFLLWAVPRKVVLAQSLPQHAEHSRWVRFEPESPPGWLRPFGGAHRRGLRVLGEALGL